MKQRNLLIAALLILAAVAFRVANATGWHFANFAPIAAMGLFGGATFKDKRLAFLLPLLGLFVSDLFFQLFTSIPGFYGVNQYFVYGAMLLVTLLGTRMGKPGLVKTGAFAIAGSLIFFLVSNFGMWAQQFAMPVDQRFYTTDFNGLQQTIIGGLPFYKYTLLGDLIFSAVLFGSYALLRRSEPAHLSIKFDSL